MIGGQLAERAQRLLAERVGFVVATVVRAQHPTSVHPGDTALVFADGTIEGFVGGTCAQASVRLHAARVLETGEPLLLRLVPEPEPAAEGEAGAGEVGTSAGGRGASDVRAGAAEPVVEGVAIAHNPCLSGGALDVFLEPLLPAPRLVILGEAPIALALERLASAAGYTVARESAGAPAPRPDDAACVVASHGRDEEAALSAALTAGVPYVALVASARRGAAVAASLDLPDALRTRLHVPAGLAIGARTPVEVAISILAQIVAEQRTQPAALAVHPAKAATDATTRRLDAIGTPADARAASAVTTAIDPVCGMEVAVTEATPSIDAPGGRAYFCCEGCRTTFAAQPAADQHVR
ncbi:XdhC family protein [Conexibacter sp. CPCC 206217]|uniref:XdhC family protein n=1 Tax=Conexibacter sp. CPCC 206217 TaxID=3064574 RepID=UPI00271E4EFD|nr:XdhC family protein [Conexibacter sp. CPCC 206217]MDO8210630.1 XdhC family protein [Conexibacter sp. CPCC 206217]